MDQWIWTDSEVAGALNAGFIGVKIDADLEKALVRHRGFIRAVARRLVRDDAALAADLEQEAGILLWRLDPTRFGESDRDYIRGALFKRMLQVARSERRASGGDMRLSLSQ